MRYSITPDSCFYPIELELPYKSCHHSLLQSGPELDGITVVLSFSSKFYDGTRLAAFIKDLNKSVDIAAQSQLSDKNEDDVRHMKT
jgi:hypothetical protein